MTNAIEIALVIRREVNKHPLISKYFHALGADRMIPAEYRQSGFVDFLTPGANWSSALRSMQEDQLCLDPTRMTLGLRHRGIRRHSIQEPARQRLQRPAQQDLAQQRAAAVEHHQHRGATWRT